MRSNDVSPFGNGIIFKKAKKTLIFGLSFIYYSLKFILAKISSKNNVFKFLKSKSIPIIKLEKPINNKNSVDKIKSEPDLLVLF